MAQPMNSNGLPHPGGHRKKRLKGISTPDLSTPSFNPGPSNPRLFNHELFNHEFLNHACRDATGNPRNPFPEVPGRFSPPRSPVIRIQHPVPDPVPATIPRLPPKSNYFDNFLHFLNFFIKSVRSPLNLVVFDTNFGNSPRFCHF